MKETRVAMKQVQDGNKVQEERKQKYVALYQQYQQHIQLMQQENDDLLEKEDGDLKKYDPNGVEYANFFDL